MARKTMDCRRMPSESNCTVVISGDEDQVLELAASHAVSAHGHTDGPGPRAALRDEQAMQVEDGSFVQVIEFRPQDLDGFRSLVEEWRDRIGRGATARWAVITADRDRPGTVVALVGFPAHDSAMRNSEHPATTDFAKRLQEATQGEAGFRNLDVRAVMRM